MVAIAQNIPFLLSREAWRVENTSARYKFVLGGRGWGKSEFGIRSAIIHAMKKPNQVIWYFAPTFQQVKDITLKKFKALIPHRKAYKLSSPITISFPNGSEISLRSADTFERVRGVDLNYMIWDEFRDFKQGFEMTALPCLRSEKDKLLIITTPANYRGYDYFMDGQQGVNDWKSWAFSTMQSPFADKGAIASAQRNLSERDFNQEYKADWISATGLVAHSFDIERNVASDVVYDENLPLYISNDFNISPMVSLITQPHGAGCAELWAIDEIISNDISTFEHTQKVVNKYKNHKAGFVLFGDATGRGRQRTGMPDWDAVRETFTENGIRPDERIPTSNPRVKDRIAIMNGFLKPCKGAPRLYFNSNCEKMIRDLSSVSRSADGGIDKACERLGMGHLIDALGYVCNELSEVA